MKNRSAKSFVAIMLVIAVSSLILRFTIERLIKVSIVQNDSNAKDTLRLISTALENYAKDHQGAYPTGFSLLIQAKPPYLEQDYLAQSPIRDYIKGYNYNCGKLDSSGYNCSASPVKCKLTGKMTYTVITGGSFISEECNKKE